MVRKHLIRCYPPVWSCCRCYLHCEALVVSALLVPLNLVRYHLRVPHRLTAEILWWIKIRSVITEFSFGSSNNTSLTLSLSHMITFHIYASNACDHMSLTLTSVRRVTKMKAPAESGQASWSQISRTWLKHTVTSTAEELCFACCTGSSCQSTCLT